MKALLDKYSHKLITQGLCDPAPGPLIAGLDAEMVWNREDPFCTLLEEVVSRINISSILFARPAEPYFSIINHICEKLPGKAIYPEDCETRTFLHDIPVACELTADVIVKALKERKGLVVPGHGIVTFGTVSPEQAFVTYSSICFSCYVKFFSDCLARGSQKDPLLLKTLSLYGTHLEKMTPPSKLGERQLQNPGEVIEEIIKAGALTVENRLVDSFFGNISYKLGDTIYISQTGSSLDELGGCIDPCPVDGSTCSGITASSELSAHKDILLNTENLAILHGHPKFSVIMSMLCEKVHCDYREECFRKCPETRFIDAIPIVPGEVGTGQYGLCHTLPPAIKGQPGVIVYGHGVFTVSPGGFREAYNRLRDIEKRCFHEYTLHIGL